MSKLHRATLHLGLAAVLLSALAATTACDNSYGCLANAQEQIAQEGTSTFKAAMVAKVARLGDSYYAATSKLYGRAVSGGSWSVVSVAGSASYTLLSMASGASTLYVSILDASDANKVYSTTDGSAWSELGTGSLPSTAWIDSLFASNGTLFAQSHDKHASSTGSDHAYTLLYWNGSSFAAAGGLASLAVPLVGVEWDGASYWYASTAKLYSGTAAPDGAATDVTSSSTTGLGAFTYSSITSLRYSAIDAALYAGTYTGYIAKVAGTGAPNRQSLGSSPVYALECVGSKIFAGLGTTTSVSTGGYFEGVFGSLASGDGGSYGSQYSTTVYGKAVVGFYWDATASRLFACLAPGSSSSSYGLYSAASADWVAE